MEFSYASFFEGINLSRAFLAFVNEDLTNKIIIHNLYIISGVDLIAWMMKSMDIDDQGIKFISLIYINF